MDTNKTGFCQKAYLGQTIYSWIVLSIKISDNFNANFDIFANMNIAETF